MLISDYFSSFYLNLLVEPLAVTATLSSTLVGATLGAGVEAAQAVFVEAVAEVHPAVQQQALAVVDFALGWDNLPVKGKTSYFHVNKSTSFDANLLSAVDQSLLSPGLHFNALLIYEIPLTAVVTSQS